MVSDVFWLAVITHAQVTFQAREVDESRHLYDQLAALTPMLLALTAATPFARGALLDTDSRWDIISQSVDDRTPAERRPVPPPSSTEPTAAAAPDGAGQPFPMASSAEVAAGDTQGVYHPAMAAGGTGVQHKSRYASISVYICAELAKKHATCLGALNDVPAPYDRGAYERLLAHGIDKMLARHVAHLFSYAISPDLSLPWPFDAYLAGSSSGQQACVLQWPASLCAPSARACHSPVRPRVPQAGPARSLQGTHVGG